MYTEKNIIPEILSVVENMPAPDLDDPQGPKLGDELRKKYYNPNVVKDVNDNPVLDSNGKPTVLMDMYRDTSQIRQDFELKKIDFLMGIGTGVFFIVIFVVSIIIVVERIIGVLVLLFCVLLTI